MPDFANMTIDQFFEGVNTDPDSKYQYDQQETILKKIFSSIPEHERPIQKLLAMQFEYYDPSQPAGQRSPARKEFWRTVSKYTDINGVDKKMRESIQDNDPLLKSAHSYVESEEYSKNIKERLGARSRAWTSHKQADARNGETGGFRQNTQFREAVKERLQQTDAEIVSQEIQALKDQGMTSNQIRRQLSKQWHPDNGISPDDEKIRLLNDSIDRRIKQEKEAQSAQTDRPQNSNDGNVSPDSTAHDGSKRLSGEDMQSW